MEITHAEIADEVKMPTWQQLWLMEAKKEQINILLALCGIQGRSCAYPADFQVSF